MVAYVLLSCLSAEPVTSRLSGLVIRWVPVGLLCGLGRPAGPSLPTQIAHYRRNIERVEFMMLKVAGCGSLKQNALSY
jgi:hypothetical protein